MANSILAKLAVYLTANTVQLRRELNAASGQLNKFRTEVTDSVKGVAAAFGAVQLAQFALDVSKLAGEAEGVKRAFDKLPNSVRVMNELKAVTAGTVSELELMKRAVTATNFGIELEQLPKLLEFATVRAQQTGQSVDYLVDSIVTGIGRKSPLILDNLGISTTRLKDKFNGAALEAQNIADVAKAVGEIAEEELGKMGTMSENAATKLQRLNAEWVNLKVTIGNSANNTGVLGSAIDTLVLSMRSFVNTTKSFSGADLLIFFNTLALNPVAAIKSINDLQSAVDKLNEASKIKNNKTILGPEAAKSLKDLIPPAKQLTQEEKDRLEALRKINEERQKELARLSALYDVIEKRSSFTGPTVAGFDRSQLTFEKPDDKSIQSMANAQDALAAATERANQKQQIQNDLIREQQAVFANAAISIGDAIGSAISANESFAQVMIKTTQVIIDQIQKQVIANIVAGSSKLFAANPLLGIGVVGLAGGIIKGLLGKIGGGGGGYSAVGAVRPSFSRASVGMVQSSVVVTGVIRGQDIYLSNQNYQKASGYTKG